MSKSLFTNLAAAALVATGLLLDGEYGDTVLATGLFALSGGLTNWLAVHMLFERVPGFYGSGVIPARFREFKEGIRTLIMEQFFSLENMESFFRKAPSGEFEEAERSALKRLVDKVDLNGAFEALMEVIMRSPFAGALSMLGGVEALKPLREPFVEKMRDFLMRVGEEEELREEIRRASASALLSRVEVIVDSRLEELTPQLVKEIVQRMIREHLGWLVVWGGVIGGLIGLAASLLL